MSESERKHARYIGDEILESLRIIDEESGGWDLRGRHPSEVDYDVSHDGENYILVIVNE